MPLTEATRLEVLDQYKILDTPSERDFDELVRLAAEICQTPMSLISLVDKDRQWFKGRYGVAISETPRSISFCAHTILHPDKAMEVEDASKDPRFRGNELVTGPLHLRYYLGVPLVSPEGQALGTLCVLDRKPRHLNPMQKRALRVLARQVMTQLELRRRMAELSADQRQTHSLLEHKCEELHTSKKHLAQQNEELTSSRSELEAERARYQALFDLAPDAYLVTDLNGTIQEANSAACHLLRYQVRLLPHLPLTRFIVSRDAHQVRRLLKSTAEGHPNGDPPLEVFVQPRRQAGKIPCSITVNAVTDGSERVIGVRWLLRDITASKQAEAALRTLFDTAPLSTFLIDPDTERILDCNKQAAQSLGYTPDQLRRLRLVDIEAQLTPQEITAKTADVARGEQLRFETRHRTRSGEVRDVLVTARSLYLQGRHINYATAIDITEAKRAQEDLRQSERRLRVFFDSAMFGALDWTADGRVLQINDKLLQILGYSREEFQQRRLRWTDFTAPEYRAADEHSLAEIRARGVNTPYEKELIRKDGSRVPIILGAASFDEQRRQGVAFVLDNTQRKHAEEALQQSEKRYRTLFEHSPDAILLTIPDGRITAANPAACAMLGMTEPEIIRAGRAGLADPEDARHAVAVAERDRTGYVHAELNFIRKGGERFPAEVSSVVLGGDPLRSFIILRDISFRKQAEQGLQRRTFHLQLLHEFAARLLLGQQPVQILQELHNDVARAFGADVFLIYLPEPDRRHLRLAACAGVTAEEQRQLSRLRFGRAICARPAEALQPIIATRIQTEQAPNRRFVRKLGLRSYLYFPLILNHRLHATLAFASHSRDDYDQMDRDFFHTIAGTLAEALERERLEKELQTYAHHLEDLVRERTARIEEALAELEHFSYTITHDLRAPLRAMSGLAAVLLEECAGSIRGQPLEFLRRIADSAARMDKLITDALQYSRVVRGMFPVEPVDADELLRGILESYPNLQPHYAHIRIANKLPVVMANKAGLTQCFSNLLGNAVKFVHPGEVAQILIRSETALPQPPEPPSRVSPTQLTTWHISPSAAAAASPAAHLPPPMVRIWVEDKGIGIEQQYHDKIWVTFQRLNRAYEGTGIGLALVRKAVERMGGRVGVESEPGRGSRFWVELHLAPATSARPGAADSSPLG